MYKALTRARAVNICTKIQKMGSIGSERNSPMSRLIIVDIVKPGNNTLTNFIFIISLQIQKFP